ncbi:MAG TPA: HisA/HisF-related TIM barrel protein [Gemmataceae bacterium]|jgi:phosphoribosylformimino-5-aminoimidazole carboxamide ribotide isomerase|nr:HisA/HisF-related TIM barrel protein [Gemmataceae bacterium]
MRVIPVLDLKAGEVVRGIGGRRAEYRPITSVLTDSAKPLNVARAFRDRLGLRECYLADLDAIAGSPPQIETYQAIQSLGIRLWVDAGVREVEDALALDRAAVHTLVVGLETIARPEALGTICRKLGPAKVLFSLDLKEGCPLGACNQWKGADARAITAEAVALGIRRLLVLDLARVGMGDGTGTVALCRELACRHPDLELIAGGGICNAADLKGLQKNGVSAALVASALHNGNLMPKDWGRPWSLAEHAKSAEQ